MTDSEEEKRARVQRRGKKGLPHVHTHHPGQPGRRLRVYGATEEEAIAKSQRLAQLRAAVRAGELSQREASVVTRRITGGALKVKDVWDDYAETLSSSWGDQARSVWRYQLAPFFGPDEDRKVPAMYAFDVDDAAWRKWEQWMTERRYAQTTIRGAYNCMHAAYGLAVRAEKLPKMPWTDTGPCRVGPGKTTRRAHEEDPDKREAARDWQEAQRLIRAAGELDAERTAKGYYADMAYRVAIMMLCGLRQGEACALGWDHVEIDGDEPATWTMRINYATRDQWVKECPDWERPKHPPKGPRGGKKRTIAIAIGAREALLHQRALLHAYGLYQKDGPVFPSRFALPKTGRWRTHAELIDPDTMRKIAERADLPNPERWVTHSLRHSFSTIEAALSAGDIRSVQARCGHSDIRTTQGYMHRANRGAQQPSFTPGLDRGVLPPPRAKVVVVTPALPVRAGEPVEVVEASPVEPSPARELEGPIPLVEPTAVTFILDAVARNAREQAAALDVAEARRAARRERAKSKARLHRRSAFEPLIIAWVEAGKPGLRPNGVTAHADRRYERTYKAALREGDAPERAQRRAKAARNSCLAAFTKVLKRIESAGGRPIPPAPRAVIPPAPPPASPEPDPWGLAPPPAEESKSHHRAKGAP